MGLELTTERRIRSVVQSHNHYTTETDIPSPIWNYFVFANGAHRKNRIKFLHFSNQFYSKTMEDQGFWLGWGVSLWPWKIFMFNEPERGVARNAILIQLKMLFLWCKLSRMMKNSPKCKFLIMDNEPSWYPNST